MDDFVLTAVLFKVGYAFAALALVYWVFRKILSYSREMDERAGIDFKDSMAIMKESPEALANYKGRRIHGLLILAGCLCLMLGMLWGCSAQAAPLISDRYDRQIGEAVEKYWPDYPFPTSWKAQLYQESRLDPAAVSPVGAAGLAQFMPATWRQVVRELRLPPGVSPHHELAITAGAYYMARLRRQWSAPRPADDRQRLAQASYNGGIGNMLAAQRLCGDPPLYADIIRCLPQVTGRHARETIGYVPAIARWRRLIEAGG